MIKNEWVVMVPENIMDYSFDSYIHKVISYNKNRMNTSPDISYAHRYQQEKTAIRAAIAFGGKIVIYE